MKNIRLALAGLLLCLLLLWALADPMFSTAPSVLVVRNGVVVGSGVLAIGITPFIARLQQLAAWPNGRPVDLVYTTSLLDAQGVASLRADALAAGITLHALVNSEDGRLSAAHIREAVPDWRSGSVWFCGPAAFGAALRHDMLGMGLARNAFHQELFALRG